MFSGAGRVLARMEMASHMPSAIALDTILLAHKGYRLRVIYHPDIDARAADGLAIAEDHVGRGRGGGRRMGLTAMKSSTSVSSRRPMRACRAYGSPIAKQRNGSWKPKNPGVRDETVPL